MRMESRSGVSSPLGKLLCEVKTRLPEPTLSALERMAAAEGLPIGEYLRDLIMVHVHGIEELASMHRDRLARIGQSRAAKGPR